MTGCVMRIGNDGLDCADRACYRCGWNPVIEERRKADNREMMSTMAVNWKRSRKNKARKWGELG